MDHCAIHEKWIVIQLMLLLLLLQRLVQRMAFVIDPSAVAKAKDTVNPGECWQFTIFLTSFSSPVFSGGTGHDDATPHVLAFCIEARLPAARGSLRDPVAAQAAPPCLVVAEVGVAALRALLAVQQEGIWAHTAFPSSSTLCAPPAAAALWFQLMALLLAARWASLAACLVTNEEGTTGG